MSETQRGLGDSQASLLDPERSISAPSAPKALQSGYGAIHYQDRDEARKNTAKSMIAPGERKQEVFTPEKIWRPIADYWGGIALDPCGHLCSPVEAGDIWLGQKVDTGRTGKNGPIMEWVGPGIERDWVDRTFWNPPYDDLERWLPHAARQPGRWCGLFPVRPHRKWWRALAMDVDAICWLDPVKFVGHTQALPVPLCLMYRGDDFANVVGAVAGIGEWSTGLQDVLPWV